MPRRPTTASSEELGPGRGDPQPQRRQQRKRRGPECVVEHDDARRFGGGEPLDADHHQRSEQRADGAHEHAGLEACGERARIDDDADEPDHGDERSSPAGALAQERKRQRNHEQRPGELQRHGVGEQHVRDRPEEADVADGADRAANRCTPWRLVRSGSSGLRANSGSTNRNPISDRKNRISSVGMRDPSTLTSIAMTTSVNEPIDTSTAPRAVASIACHRVCQGFCRRTTADRASMRRYGPSPGTMPFGSV